MAPFKGNLSSIPSHKMLWLPQILWIVDYANKSSNSFQSLIMQVDSAILTQTFKDIAFKPYLGLSFGVIQQSNKELLGYNDKGFVYGVNMGLSYIVNDNIDFDLGYRFLKTSKMKELDKINNLSFSLHYFY